MRFSIIIPTCNEERDIAATLEALLGLDYPDWEIVVLDDSSDRTPEIVGGYARQTGYPVSRQTGAQKTPRRPPGRLYPLDSQGRDGRTSLSAVRGRRRTAPAPGGVGP